MNCDDTRTLLGGYVDGELDLVRSMEVERHAAGCNDCSGQLQGLQTLHTAMSSPEMKFRAPKELLRRIDKSIDAETKEDAPRSTWRISRWAQFAYAAALVAVVVVSVAIWRVALSRDRVADQVVASHVRSLMADHLFDVQSTDQHTVKPWFHGKLDYAPPVRDFATEGYPLVGGRLDVLEGQSVAALIYQRRQHPINVFVWPTSDSGNSRPRNLQRNGYNLIEWKKDGMEYWLISDLSDNELRAFAQMLQQP